MSYKTPTIPTLTLKGIDDRVQDIQVALASGLSWLTKSFGLAERIVELRDGGDYIYPAVFESNTIDPVSMMPGDAWDAYCFWTKSDTASIDNNTNFPPKNPIITYAVSCIFYIDIRRIDNTLTYKETKSKIREDIFNFFNKVKVSGELEQIRFIDDDITKVFAGFSIEQTDNKFKMYPKWACRMDFELSYRDGCYTTNTYSIT